MTHRQVIICAVVLIVGVPVGFGLAHFLAVNAQVLIYLGLLVALPILFAHVLCRFILDHLRSHPLAAKVMAGAVIVLLFWYMLGVIPS